MLYKGKVCVIFGILARGRLEPQGMMLPPRCWKKLGNNAGFGGGLLYWECGKMGFAKKGIYCLCWFYMGKDLGGGVFSFFSGKNIIPGSVGGRKEKKPVLLCSLQPYVMHAEY